MTIQPFPRRIGSDTLLRKGDQLIVCSRADMDEWQIRQTRKTIIQINGEDWCLVGKQYTAAKEVRYFLDPWPDLIKEIPGRRIRYDEEYVRARNEAMNKRRLESRIGPILHYLKPLIGFLPSCVKLRIESDFGIPARNATFMSIIVELLLFFMLGAFVQIFTYGAMQAPALVVFIPTFIVPVPILFADLVMRYSSYLREDASPLGLLEWVGKWKGTKSPAFPCRSGKKDDLNPPKAY